MYEYLQIKTCIDSVINFQDCFKWSRCRCGESLWCGVGLTCQKNNYVGIQNVRWVCRSESPGWRLIMHWCKLEIRDTRIDTSPNISRSPRQCSVLVQLEKFSSDLKKRCLLAAPLKSRKGKRKKEKSQRVVEVESPAAGIGDLKQLHLFPCIIAIPYPLISLDKASEYNCPKLLIYLPGDANRQVCLVQRSRN